MLDSNDLRHSFPHLVLGGARSGKSAYAENRMCEWQLQHDGKVYYLATAPRSYAKQDGDISADEEMLARIAHHQQQRSQTWQTLEEPLYLAARLTELEQKSQNETVLSAVMIDCLTLWMLNLIEAGCRQQQVDALMDFLAETRLPIIMVSNEVGLGVVPMGKLSREFVDELGRLHQQVAKQCQEVTFVTAGLPMRLK